MLDAPMSLARKLLPLINDAALRRPTESLRAGLLAEARGVVVELGFGSGLNAPHYPAAVREVIALMRDNGIPIVVFSIHKRGGLADVIAGRGVSTTISD